MTINRSKLQNIPKAHKPLLAAASALPFGLGLFFAVLFFSLLWCISPTSAHAQTQPQAPPVFRSETPAKKKAKRKRTRRKSRKKNRRKRKRRSKRQRRAWLKKKRAKWRRKKAKRRKRRAEKRRRRRMNRMIKRVNRYHTIVPQKVVAYYLGKMGVLAKQTRVLPHAKRGIPMGFRIAYLTKRAAVRRLGFRRNDIIMGVNGYSTQTRTLAMLAYLALLKERSFKVSILRHRKRRTLRIDLR